MGTFEFSPAYGDDLQTKIRGAIEEVTPDVQCHSWEEI
jgi:hypothetical protein